MNRRANSSVSPSTSRRSFAQIASALQRVLLNNKICLKINERVGDLIYHIASTETSRKNFLLLFTVKRTLDLAVNKICLYLIKFWIRFKTRNEEETDLETIPVANNAPMVVDSKSCLRNPASTPWRFSGGPTQYHIEKRVYCTPYVRRPVGKELCHFVMLYIYEDDPAVIEKIKDEMKECKRLHLPQQMCVEWKCGDINAKLFEGPKGKKKEIDEKILGKRDLYILDKIISFEVEPLESGAGQKLLKLTLSQKESSYKPTVLEFDFPYDDTTRTTAAAAETFLPVHAGSQAAGVSMLLQIDLQSDGILDTLAKHIPPRTYSTLCNHLGITFTEGDATLNRFGMDYQRATRHGLADWKTRNGFIKAQLRTILRKAKVGGLVPFIE